MNQMLQFGKVIWLYKLTENDINMLDNKLRPYFRGNFKTYLKKYPNIPKEYVIND